MVVAACQYAPDPGINIMNLSVGMMFIVAVCLFRVARCTLHKNKKAQNSLQ